MIPPSFAYYDPESLPEALDVLKEQGEDGRVLAGGQSLLPMLKLRLVKPAAVVDLHRIRELVYLRQGQGVVELGAMTTEHAIEDSPLLDDLCPLLKEVAGGIADPHVRNLGTVGGSVCHADPRGDFPTVLLALGARFTLQSTRGSRTVPADEFFVGPFVTALAPDELLTGIEAPVRAGDATGAYLKMTRRAGDFALVGVAALIEWGAGGRCNDVRIALCNGSTKPLLAARAATALKGEEPTDAAIAEAARTVEEDADPVSDAAASRQYRQAMIRVLTERALRRARERAEVSR